MAMRAHGWHCWAHSRLGKEGRGVSWLASLTSPTLGGWISVHKSQVDLHTQQNWNILFAAGRLFLMHFRESLAPHIWHILLSPWEIPVKFKSHLFCSLAGCLLVDFLLELYCSAFYLAVLPSRDLWKNSLVGIASGWTVGIYVYESWMVCTLWTLTSFKARQSEKYNCTTFIWWLQRYIVSTFLINAVQFILT